jgi:hypothetical protein
VTETVESVPDACLDAIGHGVDAINLLSGQPSVGHAADADEARAEFTTHGLACYEAAGLGGLFAAEGEPCASVAGKPVARGRSSVCMLSSPAQRRRSRGGSRRGPLRPARSPCA